MPCSNKMFQISLIYKLKYKLENRVKEVYASVIGSKSSPYLAKQQTALPN